MEGSPPAAAQGMLEPPGWDPLDVGDNLGRGAAARVIVHHSKHARETPEQQAAVQAPVNICRAVLVLSPCPWRDDGSLKVSHDPKASPLLPSPSGRCQQFLGGSSPDRALFVLRGRGGKTPRVPHKEELEELPLPSHPSPLLLKANTNPPPPKHRLRREAGRRDASHTQPLI